MGDHHHHHTEDDLFTLPNTHDDPFLEAIKHKRLDEVKKYISLGADVHGVTKEGYTPLHFAISYFAHEVARVLLENGANPNHRFQRNNTPLVFFALNKDNIDMLKLLVAFGADLEVLDDDLNNIGHFAAYNGSLPNILIDYLTQLNFPFDALNRDNLDIIAIACYAHITTPVDERRSGQFSEFLHSITKFISINSLITRSQTFDLRRLGVMNDELLEDYPQGTNPYFHSLFSFMLMSAANHNINLSHGTIQTMLQLGAKIDKRDCALLVPHLLQGDDPRLFAAYMAAGGDPFVTTLQDMTPMVLAAQMGKYNIVGALGRLIVTLDRESSSPQGSQAVAHFHRFVETCPLIAGLSAEQNIGETLTILNVLGYDLNQNYHRELNGLTPLAYCIVTAQFETAKILLKMDVNPNHRVLVESVIELFLDDSDNSEQDLDILRKLSYEKEIHPLDLALIMCNDDPDVVETLLRAGASMRETVGEIDIVSFIDQHYPPSGLTVRHAVQVEEDIHKEMEAFEKEHGYVNRTIHNVKNIPNAINEIKERMINEDVSKFKEKTKSKELDINNPPIMNNPSSSSRSFSTYISPSSRLYSPHRVQVTNMGILGTSVFRAIRKLL